MKKATFILMTVMLATFLATTSFADHHAIKIVKKENIGNYLTDAKGMTLYWFTKDSVEQSACKGGCIAKWPAYYRPEIAPPSGIDAADFGTITREDGAKQTIFRGYPLYYFFKDKMAGDTNGQSVKNIWYVIDPTSFPVK